MHSFGPGYEQPSNTTINYLLNFYEPRLAFFIAASFHGEEEDQAELIQNFRDKLEAPLNFNKVHCITFPNEVLNEIKRLVGHFKWELDLQVTLDNDNLGRSLHFTTEDDQGWRTFTANSPSDVPMSSVAEEPEEEAVPPPSEALVLRVPSDTPSTEQDPPSTDALEQAQLQSALHASRMETEEASSVLQDES